MITVQADEAARYLKTAVRVTGRTIAVYGMARLTAKENKLTIATCNENGMYSATIACQVNDEFDILIESKRLSQIMSNCTGPITISVVDYWVSITGAGVNYNIVSINTEEWPMLDTDGDEYPVTMDMLHAIAPVRHTGNETRAHIAGFLIDSSDGKLMRLSSTDSSRLHSVTGSDAYDGKKVIVNKSIIPALQQINGVKSITVGSSYIVFNGENESLTARLLEGSFPVIEDMLTLHQQAEYKKVTFDRSAIVEALERAAVMTDTGVQMFFSDGKLKIVVTNPEAGEFSSEVSVEGDVEADVYVNLRYMLDALQLAETLYLKDGTSPLVICNEPVTVVVMPMRL